MKPDSISSQPVAGKARTLRWTLVLLFLIAEFCVVGYAIKGSLNSKETAEVPNYSPWSEEVIEIAEKIPVQDGGRVKPLYSYARFQMLKLYGELKMPIQTGGETIKITPTEWMMDCLFRPELAKQMPIFRVDNTEFLKAMGLEVANRRDRISYQQLESIREALADRETILIRKIQKDGTKSLSLTEKQTYEFLQQYKGFKALIESMSFAHEGMQIEGLPSAPHSEESFDLNSYSVWLSTIPSVMQRIRAEGGELPENVKNALLRAELLMNRSRYMVHFIPPYEKDEREWFSLGDRVIRSLEGQSQHLQTAVADYLEIEKLVEKVEKPHSTAFRDALSAWQKSLIKRADTEELGAKIKKEIAYYKAKYFKHALVWFILAFVIGAFSWFGSGSKFSKIMYASSGVVFTIAVLTLIWGIYQRSSLMGRPPVGNLYDTIPFITAGAAVLLGLAELLTRRRLLLAVGSALGMMGIFMAFRFEFGDAKDHMDPLVAVLNSNYWLATHVVAVTLGYSGGLVACFLSHIYLHLRLAGVIEADKKFQHFITRSVYGVLCFTLVFSLLGTVYGGIWANDSWGRFWGWDPKENGALLIVLGTLIVLHARLAGWIKDWGLHFCAVFGGAVVAFSWWHVNMLEVGLHSYGFIKGGSVIWLFYAVEGIALIVGVLAWLIERYQKNEAKEAARLQQQQELSEGDS